MNRVRIGWGEESIVPVGKKANLYGQFYERITDTVEEPITVTAMAIECGGEEMIICSCDLVSTSHSLLLEVRRRLAELGDFPTEKLIINAIHTHTSIGYSSRSDKLRAKDNGAVGNSAVSILKELAPNLKYEELVSYEGDDLLTHDEGLELVANAIVKASVTARANLRDSYYAQGFGRAAVGMCRRVCYSDGSAKMWGDTERATFTELEGGNDSGIELLFTYDSDKKLTGVVMNVACPAQVLEHRSFISSDYSGKVKRRLREKFGKDINLLTLISPAGDQCPRDMIRWVQPETPINDPNIVRIDPTKRAADPSMFDISGCERISRRITDEICYALEDVTELVSETELIHKSFMLGMPVRRVTDAEHDAAMKAILDFAKTVDGGVIDFNDVAKMHVHAGVIERYRVQESVNVYDIEVHVARLGNIALATNPYELFLDYGNRIRAKSKAQQTFLVQLCCGSYGYLPTVKAEIGSHYSAYVSSGNSGHEGGDLLVRKTLEEINSIF